MFQKDLCDHRRQMGRGWGGQREDGPVNDLEHRLPPVEGRSGEEMLICRQEYRLDQATLRLKLAMD